MLSHPWVAKVHACSPAGLGRVIPEHHTKEESSHGSVQEIGTETGPLHMHQQHAPWAAWVSWGIRKAGHTCDIACSMRRMALRQAEKMLGKKKRSCTAHGEDPPSPLPGPASVTISIRVFSPNTGTKIHN